jgi:carbamoyltransferase
VYLAITQYLGFPKYGDEFKVMGLAPYGEPAFTAPLRQIVRLLPAGGSSWTCRSFVTGPTG